MCKGAVRERFTSKYSETTKQYQQNLKKNNSFDGEDVNFK